MSTELGWADLFAAWTLFRDPILAGIIAGASLGMVGVFVVLRRLVFVSAALTQAAGLGVAVAFFSGIHLGLDLPPLAGALLGTLGAAVFVALDPRRLRMSREALLAGVWIVASAAAVLVGNHITQEAHDIAAILFGTAVLVRYEDLVAVSVVGAGVVALALALRRPLVFASFDPDGARVQGLPVRALELGLLSGIALQVAVSTRALGALPVFAFSVLPGVAALLALRTMRGVLPLAGLLGAVAGGVGYLVAFFADSPVGATQAAVAAAMVLLAVPVRLMRGGR